MKQKIGLALVKVTLMPNAGHVHYGTGEIFNGAVYFVTKGTNLADIMPFLGPLYQRISTFDLDPLSDKCIKKCASDWKNSSTLLMPEALEYLK